MKSLVARLPAIFVLAILAAACSGMQLPITAPLPPTTDECDAVAVGNLDGVYKDYLQEALIGELSRRRGVTLTDRDKADRVVSGRVELEFEDVTGEDLVRAEKDTGRSMKSVVKDPFVSKEWTISEPQVEASVENEPFAFRSARLTFVFTVRDAAGRSVGGEETVTAKTEQRYGGLNRLAPGLPDIDDMPTEGDTVADLAREAARRLADILFPAPLLDEYILDPGPGPLGDPDLVKSVALAREGKWDDAKKIWEEILAQNAVHPAALYNLGVYREIQTDPENLQKAYDLYAKAAQQGARQLYLDALTRVAGELHRIESTKRGD
jgi:hypothetical protein